jgi:hypothetical protein
MLSVTLDHLVQEGKLKLQQGTSDIQILKLMALHVENKDG